MSSFNYSLLYIITFSFSTRLFLKANKSFLSTNGISPIKVSHTPYFSAPLSLLLLDRIFNSCCFGSVFKTYSYPASDLNTLFLCFLCSPMTHLPNFRAISLILSFIHLFYLDLSLFYLDPPHQYFLLKMLSPFEFLHTTIFSILFIAP